MRVVVDTNVVISGIFFGGKPRQVVEAVVDQTFCRLQRNVSGSVPPASVSTSEAVVVESKC